MVSLAMGGNSKNLTQFFFGIFKSESLFVFPGISVVTFVWNTACRLEHLCYMQTVASHDGGVTLREVIIITSALTIIIFIAMG